MIRDALVFLKDHLNTHLRGQVEEPSKDAVLFVAGEKMDPLAFPVGAVSVLLINIEEENTLRPPDRYRRTAVTGVEQSIQPEIRLNLYVLFVAHFSHYEDSLHCLSLIIQHFQKYRLLTQANAPGLNTEIEQLIMELTTLPFAEQNEVWNALRTTYHPSVLYKVKMIVFQDEDAVVAPLITETELRR